MTTEDGSARHGTARPSIPPAACCLLLPLLLPPYVG